MIAATSQWVAIGLGVGTVIIWSAVASFVLFKLIDIVIGLRVAEEAEREGRSCTSRHRAVK